MEHITDGDITEEIIDADITDGTQKEFVKILK